MSLRAFGLGLSAAAAFSAVAVLEAPVQAASIAGQTLSFGGTARLEDSEVAVGGVSRLNFSLFSNPTSGTANLPFGTNEAFGSFFGPDLTTFNIKDLNLKKTSESPSVTTWSLVSPQVDWLTSLVDGIGFDLDVFDLSFDGTSYNALIDGVFTPANIVGNGSWTAQGNFVGTGSSFSANITAVPTPALLPGLVGLGVAAFRKRDGQESSEQEA